jgi:uncharacterized membrane protein YeiB
LALGQRPTSGALALLGWCVAILVVQASASRWWLRRYRQGSLEAEWRYL